MRSLSRLNLLNLAAFLTIAGSAVSGVLQIDRILQRWLVLFLLLFFGFLQSRLPAEVESPQQLRFTNLLIAAQALIVVYLLWSTGLGFSFLVLFFILTVNAALHNSLKGTLLWIALFTALTALLQFRSGGWSGLLRDVAVYAGGYLFFGFVTNALNVARKAQVQNERLLAELQAKNLQLEELQSPGGDPGGGRGAQPPGARGARHAGAPPHHFLRPARSRTKAAELQSGQSL